MERTVFEKFDMDGFRINRVESITCYDNGHRLIAGTSDGALYNFECQNTVSSNTKFVCKQSAIVRSPPKERKPVLSLIAVESWGVVFAIVDGVLTFFDLASSSVRPSLPDTKGCHAFSVNERNFTIVVANKRKLMIYSWQEGHGGGAHLRKELATTDLSKSLLCMDNCLVIGYKRSYEAVDLMTYSTLKVLDVDKDQKMISVEIPASPLRPASLLVSQGLQGIVFDVSKLNHLSALTFSTSSSIASSSISGSSSSNASSGGAVASTNLSSISAASSGNASSAMMNDRLEWKSPPLSVQVLSSFLVTILSDSVEIHDPVTLSSLQRIALPTLPASSSFAASYSSSSSSISYSFSSCIIDTMKAIEYGYISSGDHIVVLRMIPLIAQIQSVLEQGRYEDAINLSTLFQNHPQIREIEVPLIHEKYGLSLYQKGEFEGALSNFSTAETSPFLVLSLFPDLVPESLHSVVGIVPPSGPSSRSASSSNARSAGMSSSASIFSSVSVAHKMPLPVLQRAAVAMIQYCEQQRVFWKDRVDAAEKLRQLGPTAAVAIAAAVAGNMPSSSMSMNMDDHDSLLGSSSSIASMASLLTNLPYGMDANTLLKMAEVLDTVLLTSFLRCSPARRSAVLELLSGSSASYSGTLITSPSTSSSVCITNRCHLESSAGMLATMGNSFTEALLWLYRSHGEHRRVLAALKEETCVGSGGAWTREQFYLWTADYLRWLWFQEDASLPPLIWNHLRAVLEYDAELGMSILTERPSNCPATVISSHSQPSFISGVSGKLGLSSNSNNNKNSGISGVNFGGRGVTVPEILSFLEGIVPNKSASLGGASSTKTNPSSSNTSLNQTFMQHFGKRNSVKGSNNNTSAASLSNVAPISSTSSNASSNSDSAMKIPFVNGRALGIAYLEWLISSGCAPSNYHNEYAQLLIEAIPSDVDVDHTTIKLSINESDSEKLIQYKVYRLKLQGFLQTSKEYSAELMKDYLPKFYLLEHSLLLSKMGRHSEVLSIYIQEFQDLNLALQYCDRVYREEVEDTSTNHFLSYRHEQSGEDVYRYLIEVLIQASLQKNPSAKKTGRLFFLDDIVRICETYSDRLDALAILSRVPSKVPFHRFANYLMKVIERGNNKLRNYQVILELFRIHEVNLNTQESL